MRVLAVCAVALCALALASSRVSALAHRAQPRVSITAARPDALLAARVRRLTSIRAGVVRGTLKRDDDADDDDNDDEDAYDADAEEASDDGAEDDEEVENEEEDAERGDIRVADFSENRVAKYARHMYASTPPISRLYLLSCIAFTVWAWLMNNNIWPRALAFDWRAITTRLQLWRLVTPFLSLGPLSLSFPLNVHFVWACMAPMERLHARQPAEFVVLLLFGMLSLLAVQPLVPISHRHLGTALGMYLSYIFGRLHQGQDTLLLGIFPVKMEHVPFIFMAVSFFAEQQAPVSDVLAIALGHCYLVAHRSGLLKPPSFLTRLTNTRPLKKQYAKFAAQLA